MGGYVAHIDCRGIVSLHVAFRPYPMQVVSWRYVV
jgi:hypothetical protein